MSEAEKRAAPLPEPDGAVSLAEWPAPETAEPGRRRPVVVLVLVFGALYGLTASRSLQGGDSGELLVVALRGGVPHPPGYPLYTLLAGIFARLPLLDSALTVSLFSALCAVAALVALYWALLRWRLGATAAVVVCGALGVSPVFWRYAGVPEVFALGALLLALTIWAAGRGGQTRGWVRAGLLGVILGLGLSNHHTIVFALPFVGLGLFRAVQELAGRRRWLVPPVFLLGLAVGLTPYLTLLGPAAQSGWYWGGGLDLPKLVAHFLRKDFGTLSLGITDMGGGLLENLWAYALHLGSSFWLLVPFGVWGLILSGAAMTQPNSPARFEGGALLLTFTVSVLGFFAMVNLRPDGLAGVVLERFYLLPDTVFALSCALGLRQLIWRRPRLTAYVRSIAVGLVSLMALAHIAHADWSEDYAVEDYLLNSLDTVEPNSVIIGTGDLQLFGFLATAEVLAYRSDVQYIDLNLLRHRWYWERVQQGLDDFDATFDAEHTHVMAVVSNLLLHHPVYVSELSGDLPELRRRLIPVGPLLRVVPPNLPMPAPARVEQMNVSSLQRLQFRGRAPRSPDSWGALAFSYYARTWDLLANAYEQAGQAEPAARARAMAQPFRTGVGP